MAPKKLTQAQRDKRAEKRERRAESKAAAPTAAFDPRPTFGLAMERSGLVGKITKIRREMITQTVLEADRASTALQVITCHTCTAAKGCCKLSVPVFLFEAVPIAERLRREHRDTPALRSELTAAAERMESLPPARYRHPCVFLDGNERCTIYEDRPSECGMTLVFNDPRQCSDPAATHLDKYASSFADEPSDLEQQFEQQAKLERLPGPYMGALPRMILLCLEAWERRDYVDFLAREVSGAAQRYIAAAGAEILGDA